MYQAAGNFLCTVFLSWLCVASASAQETSPSEPSLKTPAQEEAVKEKKSKRLIVGWVERIRLEPEGTLIDAKLTPGSEGNVLHAEHIKTFKRAGERWARFDTKDRRGDIVTLERRIVDETRFRTTDGSIAKRYVVTCPICINATYVEIDFSLANRNKFTHEARIGRDSLAGQFIIDPAKTKTTQPQCTQPEGAKEKE